MDRTLWKELSQHNEKAYEVIIYLSPSFVTDRLESILDSGKEPIVALKDVAFQVTSGKILTFMILMFMHIKYVYIYR